jgi:hypothetical protein
MIIKSFVDRPHLTKVKRTINKKFDPYAVSKVNYQLNSMDLNYSCMLEARRRKAKERRKQWSNTAL